MKNFLNNITIVQKLTALSLVLLVLTSASIAYLVNADFSHTIDERVIYTQNENIKIAATVFEYELPEFDVRYVDDGKNIRVSLKDLPSFQEHSVVDKIGQITGQTATLFLWDEATQDFWRKTTNIIKNDGARAVGTPLGKKGAVYPYMIDGKVYIGKATILGKEYFTRYDPIFKSGTDTVVGILYVGLEQAALLAEKQKIINDLLISAGISLVIAGILFLLTINVIFKRPLQKAMGQMHRLADGDKSFDISGAKRGDEIGEIAKSLQVFKTNALEVERLETEQRELEASRAEERKQATLELANEFEARVGSVVQNVEKAASDMQTMAATLAAAVEQTTQQSGSVASASQEASTNVQTVASAAEQMAASIREISANVSDTAQTAKVCAQAAQTSQDKLQHLQDAVDEIDSVIQSINEVAEQTNLLALNATIEAARAGEAGKGFAVVASEVKSLANETHKMTEEISSKVSDIKGSAKDTIDSVSDIINQISSVDTKTTNVASAIEEQNSSTAEISRNVQEAASGTGEVSRSIEEVQKAANDSSASTEQLRVAANDLAGEASTLKQAVSTFLAEVRGS